MEMRRICLKLLNRLQTSTVVKLLILFHLLMIESAFHLNAFASRAGWAPHVHPSLHPIRTCHGQAEDRLRSGMNML